MVLAVLAIFAFAIAFLLSGSLSRRSRLLDSVTTSAASFQKIHEALARYVMLNARLPCPASGTAHTGDADPNTATTTCNSPSGVVPWNTLGLAKTDAIDAWGRYVAYRVYDGTSGFTQSNGMSLYNCLDEETTTTYALSGTGSTCNSTTHENSITDFFASKGLTVNDMGTAKTKVAYVMISPGETGLGGYYPGGNAPLSAPNSSSKEFLNAGSAGTYWITAASDPSVSASDATHFDDVVSYAYASEVAKVARLAGRPWPLEAIASQAGLGLSGANFNTQANPVKLTTTTGPVMLTAAADTARGVCATSTSPVAVAPCISSVTNGNDLLSVSENETLTLDFRVTRKKLVIQLADFRQSGSNQERAQITLYNDAAQVYQAIATSTCSSGATRLGEYTIDLSAAGTSFTKVTLKALAQSGSGSSSDFGVAAVLACKQVDATCTHGSWTAATCSATL